MSQIPHKILTQRLIIRCLHPQDAVLLKDAIDSSIEHLSPRLAWTRQEPESLAEKSKRITKYREAFTEGRDYQFGIFTPDNKTLLGCVGLHTRAGKGSFAIGYWIRQSHIQQGYITETVKALIYVGFMFGQAESLLITCDPTNVRSANIARKLGFTHEATMRINCLKKDRATRKTKQYWKLFKEDHPINTYLVTGTQFYDMNGKEMKASI